MVTMRPNSRVRSGWLSLLSWFDTAAAVVPAQSQEKQIDWLRTIPFIGMHLACLAVIWVGWSPVAVATAVVLYLLRMFAITGFYHRYFSHRSFKTSRPVQFIFAVIGAASVQRGPIWWAAHHRHHHATTEQGRRSAFTGTPWPVVESHRLVSDAGTFCGPGKTCPGPADAIRNSGFLTVLILPCRSLLAIGLLLTGIVLESRAPQLGTNGAQMLVWGFFVSTVALYHGTFTINSLAHRWGQRRYATADNSRNNFWLALLTLGEGWHNNHHHYPVSVKQGFYWWEIDMTYYALRVMAALGLVWELKPVPLKYRESNRLKPARRKLFK